MSVAEAIRRDFGFVPTFDHFAIFGLCSTCHLEETDASARPTRRAPSPDGKRPLQTERGYS
jgi:hypothetical protein